MTNVARFTDGVQGIYPQRGSVAASDVTDGLSNTVIFGEKLLTAVEEFPRAPVLRSSMTPTQRLVVPATTESYRGRQQMSDFRNACGTATYSFPGPPDPPVFFLLAGDVDAGGYNHVMPPNQNSCWNGLPDDSSRNVSLAAITATSLHSGGVNVALCDGSARTVSETIDRSVWSAMATRNGGEVMDGF